MMLRRRGRFIVAGLGLCLLGVRIGRGQDSKEKQDAAITNRHVKQDRLWNTLQKLGEFGKNPEGGVSRVGFTEADLAGRAYVMGLMREAGLDVRVDPAGNIFGRRAGSEKLPLLLFGSHIDSVPHGGNFDGDVGSLGSLEVMRTMNDTHAATRHPLEMVIWVNEEGNHFGQGELGSSAAAGLLSPEILERRD